MYQQLAFIKTTTEEIWSHPTWDLILVFALLAIGFFYGISSGKGRMAATIIYTYVALAIFSALPFERLNGISNFGQEFIVKGMIFLILFFLLAFLLGSRRTNGMAPASSWWQIFLLSFLQIGLLIHLLLQMLPGDKIKLLAPLTKAVFANPSLHIWWLITPLGLIILLRRLERRSD